MQHVESLNGTVFGITGVRVQETLADAVLDQADEVVSAIPSRLTARLEAVCTGCVRDPAHPGGGSSVRHTVVIAAGRELCRPSHAGRYFGGLWFKVFSERGPC